MRPRTPILSATFAPLIFSLLLVPLSAIPATLSAQATSSVSGVVVTGERGEPLASATIHLIGTERRVTTDASGAFVLPRTPQGTVVLSVSRLGYATRTLEVAVSPEGLRGLEVTLARDPFAIDPLLVLLDRTRLVGDPRTANAIPGSAHFLSRADLAQQPSAFDDVHAALRRVPGVTIQEEEGYGMRPNIGLRGTGSERSSKITVMEDGVLAAPAPYSAPAAYFFPTLGRMEGVEVRKGSSQVRFGPHTTGGALNLVSREIPERTAWDAEFSGGGNGTFKGRGGFGGATDHLGWWIETYQVSTDGFKELQGGGATGYRLQDYLARLRVNTAREGAVYQEIELKLGWVDQESNETYLGLTDADFAANPLLRYAASQRDILNADRQLQQLRHFARLPGGFDLTTTLYRTEFARNWYKLQTVGGSALPAVLDDPDAFPTQIAILNGDDSADNSLRVRANNRSYGSSGVQTVAGLRRPTGPLRHDLEVGVRYHTDYEDRFHWDDGYRMEDGVMVLTNPGVAGSQTNRKVDARAVAFHLQDEIRFGRATVTPGVRFETIDFTDVNWGGADLERTGPGTRVETAIEAWIPGVGGSYTVSTWLDLFAGVHKGFGPPGPGASAETRPEESVNWETGLRWRRGTTGLDVAAFLSDYSNILGEATLSSGTPGDGDLYNGGKVKARGIEASGEVDLAGGRLGGVRLPLRTVYTYTRATFESDFDSAFEPWGTVERGDDLPYAPRHQYHLSLSARGDAWSVTLGADGSSAGRTVAGQGPIPSDARTDAFTTFALSGEYRIPATTRLGSAALFVGVQNLTDEAYVVARRPAGLRPGLPRTLQAGIRIGG